MEKTRTVEIRVRPEVKMHLEEVGRRFLCGGSAGAAVEMLVRGLTHDDLVACAKHAFDRAAAIAQPLVPPPVQGLTPAESSARGPTAPAGAAGPGGDGQAQPRSPQGGSSGGGLQSQGAPAGDAQRRHPRS